MNRLAIPTQKNTKPDTVNDKFSVIFFTFTQGKKHLSNMCDTTHLRLHIMYLYSKFLQRKT